jgi:hypothetical protein
MVYCAFVAMEKVSGNNGLLTLNNLLTGFLALQEYKNHDTKTYVAAVAF